MRPQRPLFWRGKWMHLNEIAKECNLTISTLWCRLYKHGWTLEQATTLPVRARVVPRGTYTKEPPSPYSFELLEKHYKGYV